MSLVSTWDPEARIFVGAQSRGALDLTTPFPPSTKLAGILETDVTFLLIFILIFFLSCYFGCESSTWFWEEVRRRGGGSVGGDELLFRPLFSVNNLPQVPPLK